MSNQFAPNGRKFPWGRIGNISYVKDYAIVEYEDKSNERVLFHPYVETAPEEYRDTNTSWETFDKALVYVIAHKYMNVNTARYAANFFHTLLDAYTEN